MKPKLLLCLALVFSGGLVAASNSMLQAPTGAIGATRTPVSAAFARLIVSTGMKHRPFIIIDSAVLPRFLNEVE